MKNIGTISLGVKAPIIRKGDNLVEITVESVLKAVKEAKLTLNDRDIVAVTEAVVAKSQGNFASVDDIAKDVRNKMGEGTIGVIFPILSRNRFSNILKGIARGCDNIVLQLSYPFDEVGNPLVSIDKLYELGITNFNKTFSEEKFYKIVGKIEHPFTGLDYIDFYKKICGDKCKIILSNDPTTILKYTKKVISADIHSRQRNKDLLLKRGAKRVITLDEILNSSVDGCGYNEEFGVLGSNLSTDEVLKLFPRDTKTFVTKLQSRFKEECGKDIECMVYGDGAFKDPVGGIWELADPVVSPAFTDGLKGTPNEIKLKYVADTQIANLSGKEAEKAMKEIISKKSKDLKNQNISLGTTPRRITDLLGSLADLTSGSGDKGTPIVLIKGYFNNYADE